MGGGATVLALLGALSAFALDIAACALLKIRFGGRAGESQSKESGQDESDAHCGELDVGLSAKY